MDGQQFVIRLVLPVLLLWIGAGLGRSSADIVWGSIYGIGGRVVTDEQYEQLIDDVGNWGAIAGACSRLAVNVLPRMWPIGAFMLLHPVSVAAGMVAGNFGWRTGLGGFFGVHVVVVLGCILFAVAAVARQSARRH